MRVTKRIEDYVKKQVEEGLPFGAPIAEFNAAKEGLKNVAAEIEQKVNGYITQLCAEANAELPEGFKVSPSNWGRVNYTWYDAPLERAAEKHGREVHAKRAKAVESILLSLELGATKADLERLISEAIS